MIATAKRKKKKQERIMQEFHNEKYRKQKSHWKLSREKLLKSNEFEYKKRNISNLDIRKMLVNNSKGTRKKY